VTRMPPGTRRGGRVPLTVGPGDTRALSISEQTRKRVEEICCWLKTVGLLRKVKLRGVPHVGRRFTFAAAAYNLVYPESGDGGDMSPDAPSALASARTSAPP